MAETVIRDRMAQMVSAITSGLDSHGCSIIGHVKAILKTDFPGYLLVSSTGPAEIPGIKGKLARSYASGKLTVNSIAYDIDRRDMIRIVEREIRAFASAVNAGIS